MWGAPEGQQGGPGPRQQWGPGWQGAGAPGSAAPLAGGLSGMQAPGSPRYFSGGGGGGGGGFGPQVGQGAPWQGIDAQQPGTGPPPFLGGLSQCSQVQLAVRGPSRLARGNTCKALISQALLSAVRVSRRHGCGQGRLGPGAAVGGPAAAGNAAGAAAGRLQQGAGAAGAGAAHDDAGLAGACAGARRTPAAACMRPPACSGAGSSPSRCGRAWRGAQLLSSRRRAPPATTQACCVTGAAPVAVRPVRASAGALDARLHAWH